MPVPSFQGCQTGWGTGTYDRPRKSGGSPDFVVISKPHILTRPGITESRTVVLDTVYTINPGDPWRGNCKRNLPLRVWTTTAPFLALLSAGVMVKSQKRQDNVSNLETNWRQNWRQKSVQRMKPLASMGFPESCLQLPMLDVVGSSPTARFNWIFIEIWKLISAINSIYG